VSAPVATAAHDQRTPHDDEAGPSSTPHSTPAHASHSRAHKHSPRAALRAHEPSLHAEWRSLPGAFQELGLFSTFRSLAPCLWRLWGIAITGQPLLVMGPSPEVCGDAVLAVVSLVAPLK